MQGVGLPGALSARRCELDSLPSLQRGCSASVRAACGARGEVAAALQRAANPSRAGAVRGHKWSDIFNSEEIKGISFFCLKEQ